MDTKGLLQIRMAELRADVEEIKSRVAPERAHLDALIAQQTALNAEVNETADAWHRFDVELIAKKQEIAAIAKALGGLSVSGN